MIFLKMCECVEMTLDDNAIMENIEKVIKHAKKK